MNRWRDKYRVIKNTYGDGSMDYVAQTNLDPLMEAASWRWLDLKHFAYLTDAEKFVDSKYKHHVVDFEVMK